MRPRTALVLILAVLCVGMRHPSAQIAVPSLSHSGRPFRPPRIKACVNSLRSKQQLYRQMRLLARPPVSALPAARTVSPPCCPALLEAPPPLVPVRPCSSC